MKTSYNNPTDSEIAVSDFACESSAPSILMRTRFLGPKKPRKGCALDSRKYVISFFHPFKENFTHLRFIVIFCWYVIKSCTYISGIMNLNETLCSTFLCNKKCEIAKTDIDGAQCCCTFVTSYQSFYRKDKPVFLSKCTLPHQFQLQCCKKDKDQ
jgi:hypothetical protein